MLLRVNPKTRGEEVGASDRGVQLVPDPRQVGLGCMGLRQPDRAGEDLRRAVFEASREAVATIAQHIGQARLGKGGEDDFEPGHVAWLEFTASHRLG